MRRELRFTAKFTLKLRAARSLLRFKGMRVLYICGEVQKNVIHKLTKHLTMDIVPYDGTQPRQVVAALGAIHNGHVDLVFLTTSFLSHSACTALQNAAKKRGVPYLRVCGGGYTVCLREMERHGLACSLR